MISPNSGARNPLKDEPEMFLQIKEGFQSVQLGFELAYVKKQTSCDGILQLDDMILSHCA